MTSWRTLLAMLVLVASVATGCHRSERPSAASVALQSMLDGTPAARPDVWPDVRAFYATRGGTPAWVSGGGKLAKADAVLAVFDRARAHGLSANDYGRDALVRSIAAAKEMKGPEDGRADAVARLDLSVTSALLTLGHDVALGHTRPSSIDARWKSLRTAPDFAQMLNTMADHDLDAWLEHLQPPHEEYRRLQQALQSLDGQREKGGWPAVPAAALAPGRTHHAVLALRRRLAASGQLTGAAATSASTKYDPEVVTAVKAFQEHHTLKVNGVADAATIAALNVPIEDRIEQVALNLERWRWMPDDFGSRYLLVNIPSYHVVARENGKDVLDIRVVVGKPGHETPVFSEDMTTVVFSPYWNIPDTIAEGETVPALIRDPKYLERNGIEVLRATKSGSEPVDVKKIDWDDDQSLKTLMFRQKPGPKNALGHVKFLFPNKYDVYLHDTPADALFARTGRAFSHGCVRVEQPEALAEYVLRGDDRWNETKIRDAMNAGVQEGVKLKTSIPVHIVYFTATVDENGGLHLLTDVYGYDAKQLESRRSKTPSATRRTS
jgi:murein L,D-transpeptidase YcbB/YkuD